MKKCFAALVLFLVAARAPAVDSITFKETYTERLVRGESAELIVASKVTRSFSAEVTYPEAGCVRLEARTVLEFRVGDEGYGVPLGSAGALSNAQYAFMIRDDAGLEIGRMSLRRTNSTLLITGTYTRPGESIVTGPLLGGESGPVGSTTIARVALGNFSVERTVFLKGRQSVAHRSDGGSGSVDLHTITMSGAADFSPPVVSVVSHRTRQRVSTNAIELRGVVRDHLGEVTIFGLQNGVELPSIGPDGAGAWSFPIELAAGTNAFSIWAVNSEGNISATNTLTLFRVVPALLDLKWNNGGTVTGVTHGQLLEVGRGYRVNARPAATNRFGGWNGGGDAGAVHSPEATLNFIMQPGMSLHASFILPTLAPITLAVTPGNGVVGLTHGQMLEVGRMYRVVAQPAPGNVFVNWSGSVQSSDAAFRFIMESNTVLEANFAANPWLSVADHYAGLIFEALGDLRIPPLNSGTFVLNITSNGRITGNVRMLDGAFPFSGQAGLDGIANIPVTRPRCPEPMMLHLEFDVEGDDESPLVGELSCSSFDAFLSGIRPVADARYAGRYTFSIGGGDGGPAGAGAGTVRIDGRGKVTLAGTLGDGTPLALSTVVSRNGVAPLHTPLYGGRGSAQCWFSFNTNAPPIDLSGPDPAFVWFKSPVPADPFFPEGFVQLREFVAVRYTPPPPGTNALLWTDGIVELSGGNLPADYEHAIRILDNVVTLADDPMRVVVKPKPRTGLFSMSFTHPLTGKSVTGKGALLQYERNDGGFEIPVQGKGAGWFRGIDQTGYIHLLPAPRGVGF